MCELVLGFYGFYNSKFWRFELMLQGRQPANANAAASSFKQFDFRYQRLAGSNNHCESLAACHLVSVLVLPAECTSKSCRDCCDSC